MNQILSMNNEPDKKQDKNLQNNQMNMQQKSTYQPNYNINQNQSKPSHNYNDTIKRANATSNKAEISKVIRIFCVIIILFGLFLIGESTYAMVAKRKKVEDNPKVYPLQMGKETKITVETEHPIKEFSYKWNEGESVKIEGNGTVLFETTIQIPNGNNILYMTVTDFNGNEHNFHRQYIFDSTDANKPTIDIAISGTKLKITATDDVEMDYITYSWNNEEATRVDLEEDEDKQNIETDVDVPEGQNKLTIIAVDAQGNRETRTENVIGDTKPIFDLLKDGQNLIIKAQDDQGVSRIVMDIDGEIVDSGEESIDLKEVSASIPVESGTHTIKVTVTNVNGLSDTKTATVEF